MRTVDEEDEEESEGRKTPVRAEMKSPNASKPPRGPPSSNNNNNSSNITSASLDRRQRSRSQSHRRERDSKSRSTHSLKENDLNEKILIGNNLQAKDNNSSSSCSNRRMSPITWEAPPPPPFYPYDKWEQYYYKHHVASRDDLRSMEYYRRPTDPFRIGSCQELFHHPSQLSLNAGNCESPYFHFPPPPPCCNNHFYPPYQVNEVFKMIHNILYTRTITEIYILKYISKKAKN